MAPKKQGRSSKNRSISFPPELLDRAVARAASMGLNFSSYVQLLVRADLGRKVLDAGLVADPEPARRVAEEAPKGSPS